MVWKAGGIDDRAVQDISDTRRWRADTGNALGPRYTVVRSGRIAFVRPNQLVVKLTRFRLSGMKLDDGAAAGWLGLLARQSLVRAIELNSAVA
jgi:hypothetical protein